MTPVKQLYRHDPDQGVQGDCLRAAIASMLDLPAADVPHFAQPDGPGTKIVSGPTGLMHVEHFLEQRGWTLFQIVVEDTDNNVDAVLQLVGDQNWGVHWLLIGRSIAGNHVVVCKGPKIVHDPAQDKRDPILTGPLKGGYWRVCVIAKHDKE